MTYTHLTPDELIMIEAYAKAHQSVTKTAQMLKRSRQTIYTVYAYLKDGHTALEYYQNYKKNKAKCGRRSIVLPAEQVGYIRKKVVQGWTPDVIIGRGEFPIGCSVRTLYRMFKMGIFDCSDLLMKGKRKPNGHQEKRGKHAFRRSIHERSNDYTSFEEEFGHLEGDTIVGQKHKSAVITLVERLSKVIITLQPEGRRAIDIENRLNQWMQSVPKHLFKSMTFDCGKEFSNWKNISNINDISIYFADPGTPSQRGLNENSNGLLRRDGLYKAMDFNGVSETFIQSVASKRNHIPRKSLNYRTPLELFLSYICKEELSNLI
ncbi:Mobile element protein [Lactococcus lactis subsp. lactis]|uniref:IS30 family transposase n=1 Tax=Lactococcus lactis TaxID=1358 RepID=UPI00071C4AA4|nr:IS30 family transposase [Lactococcus lactis]KST88507.1 Mobile element protein [Lactococcus lactis subsp. lactis]